MKILSNYNRLSKEKRVFCIIRYTDFLVPCGRKITTLLCTKMGYVAIHINIRNSDTSQMHQVYTLSPLSFIRLWMFLLLKNELYVNNHFLNVLEFAKHY